MKMKTIQTLSILVLICIQGFIILPQTASLIIMAFCLAIALYKKENATLNFFCALCLLVLLELWFQLSLRDSVLIVGLYALYVVQFKDRGITYVIVPIALIVLTFLLIRYDIFLQEPYSADDFGYEIHEFASDFNANGQDDGVDILEGAYHQVDLKPKYKSAYYDGGYPPVDEGVCTDVIWRSLNQAGYDLKSLIDLDIKQSPDAYPYAEDKNIDFRRVRNLITFFERNTQALSQDLDNKASWQPGDIVFFSTSHVGILSDHYTKGGLPRLIHSAHPFQLNFEQDALARLDKDKGISGHFRWILNDHGQTLLSQLT